MDNKASPEKKTLREKIFNEKVLPMVLAGGLVFGLLYQSGKGLLYRVPLREGDPNSTFINLISPKQYHYSSIDELLADLENIQRRGYNYVVSLSGLTIEDIEYSNKELEKGGAIPVGPIIIPVPRRKEQYNRIDFVLSDSDGKKVRAWITTYSDSWSDAINSRESDQVNLKANYLGDRELKIWNMENPKYRKSLDL